ncbi:uncharacterized protein LOC141915508 isoform X2 [Tubulanus polymorphus]|uniref:uncharacterized protein LOC141915508 isoform X2 n=1 Tax=Tubulanus polymorphus TaxID=672921 RepID=UPI003DA3F637
MTAITSASSFAPENFNFDFTLPSIPSCHAGGRPHFSGCVPQSDYSFPGIGYPYSKWGRMAPAWCLVDRNGTQYKLPKAMIFLGREECDVLLKSRSVDPRHAVITFDHYEDLYKVKDLGSLNGTFVNEKRIPEEEYLTLSHLDTIRFGYDPMVYRIEKVDEADGKCEIDSILSQAAKIPAWAKREAAKLPVADCPGCYAEQRAVHHYHHTCADTPPSHVHAIHPTLPTEFSKQQGYYNSWPRQARTVPAPPSAPVPMTETRSHHTHYHPDYQYQTSGEHGPSTGHVPPHSGATYLPEITRHHPVSAYTHQQPYYQQSESVYVTTQHGHYPVTQHTYSHEPVVSMPVRAACPTFPPAVPPVTSSSTVPPMSRFQHADSLEKDDDDSQCGTISESFALLAEYRSPEFGEVMLEGDLCNNNVIATVQSGGDSVKQVNTPMTPDSIGGRHDRRRSVPADENLETVKKCTPLYGQPSWWGDEDAEYNYPHTATRQQGGAAESSTADDNAAERPSSLVLKSPAGETRDETKSSGSAPRQQQQQPAVPEPSMKPPEGVSMAFTVEFDDTATSSKKFSMKDKLSKFVPNKMRKSFRERQLAKKDKDGSEEDKDLSPKEVDESAAVGGDRENRKRAGYASDGNNQSPSDEEMNVKSEVSSKDKRAKVMARRASAPPRPVKNSVFSRLSKSKTSKQQSTPSNVSSSSLVPESASYLIDKMFDGKSSKTATSKAGRRKSAEKPTEYEMYSEASKFDSELKNTVSGNKAKSPGVSNGATRKALSLQKSPGFAVSTKRKKSIEIVEENVDEQVGVDITTNGHDLKTDGVDHLDVVDNTDNVSEAGTYTIGEDSKSKDLDEARQNIDTAFGVDDGLKAAPRGACDPEDSGSDVSDRILDDDEDFDADRGADLDELERKRSQFRTADSMDVEVGSAVMVDENESDRNRKTTKSPEEQVVVHEEKTRTTTQKIPIVTKPGRRLPALPTKLAKTESTHDSHEQQVERMPPDGSSPKHRSLERLDFTGIDSHGEIIYEENGSSSLVVKSDTKFKTSKSADFSTATWTKKGPRLVEVETGVTWTKSTLKNLKKEYNEKERNSARSGADPSRFGFRHARSTSDVMTTEQSDEFIDDALKLNVDESRVSLDTDVLLKDTHDVMKAYCAKQSPRSTRKYYDNCDSRTYDDSGSDAGSSYAGGRDDASPRNVVTRSKELSSAKKPPYSPRSLRKLSSGSGGAGGSRPNLKKEMTSKEKVLLHLNNQTGKRGSLPGKMDPSCVQHYQYPESADGISETNSVSDISDTCMSDIGYGFNRAGSGGKGKMSMTRPNRAFALRRARLEAENDTLSSSRTNTSKSSSTSKLSSASRNTGVTDSSSRVSLGAKIVKRSQSDVQSGNLSRADGGRYSLRGVRRSSSGADKNNDSRHNQLAASKSSTSLIVSGKSAKSSKSSPSTAKSTSQPNSRSNSPKSVEKTAWLRRKEYDPRKAAADAKKAAAKKKGPKIVKPVVSRRLSDDGENDAYHPPVRRIRKDTYTSSNEDLSLSLDSTKEDYEGEMSEQGSEECTDKIAKISSELAKDLQTLSSGIDEHGNYLSPQTEFRTEELLASMFSTSNNTTSSAFQSPRSSKSNTPCSQLCCTCPSSVVARRRYRNRTPLSDQEDYAPSSTRGKTYDSLFVSSIQCMSAKLRESTQGLISKLRENEVLTESPVQDLPDEQSENELPGYKAADQDLAAILKNLRIVEKHIKAIDVSLFPESSGCGSTIETSADDSEYRRRVEQLSDFKPIDHPSTSSSSGKLHHSHRKQKSSDSSAADFDGEEYF